MSIADRMAEKCHTLLHFDHWRFLSTQTTFVSTWACPRALAIRFGAGSIR